MKYDSTEFLAEEDLLQPKDNKENEGDGEMGGEVLLMMTPQS